MLSPVEVRRFHRIIARWLGPGGDTRNSFRNDFAEGPASSASADAGGQAQEQVVLRALDALELQPGRGLR